MKKIALAGLLLALFAWAPRARAQQTLVTGCVTDPNGIKYTGGQYSIQLVNTGGAQPSVNGVPIQGSFGPVPLDSSGCIAPTTLYENSVITPSGTEWQFTVNNPGAAPPVGYGPVSFTAPAITISGATQNITSNLTGAALPLLQVGGAGSTVSFANITSGTNTMASMVVGTGAEIAHTGTGLIFATNIGVNFAVQVTGSIPETGWVLTATSDSTADWEAPSGGGSCTGSDGEICGLDGGTLTGLPGSSADFTNGLLALAPTGTGTALTVTGDAAGADAALFAQTNPSAPYQDGIDVTCNALPINSCFFSALNYTDNTGVGGIIINLYSNILIGGTDINDTIIGFENSIDVSGTVSSPESVVVEDLSAYCAGGNCMGLSVNLNGIGGGTAYAIQTDNNNDGGTGIDVADTASGFVAYDSASTTFSYFGYITVSQINQNSEPGFAGTCTITTGNSNCTINLSDGSYQYGAICIATVQGSGAANALPVACDPSGYATGTYVATLAAAAVADTTIGIVTIGNPY